MDDIKAVHETDMEDMADDAEHEGADHGAEGGAGTPAGKGDRVFNRQRLVGVVAEKTGLPRAKALAAIEAVFETMSASLKEGKEVRVLGFGAFNVSQRKAGKGRDPRTGAEIDVPQSKSVRFRASKALREMVVDTPVDSSRASGEDAQS